jgi:hypothetical protein
MRSILYVDGFNFYYGVTRFWKDRNFSLAGLGWCDFAALATRHFGPLGILEVKYFTSPVTRNVQLESHLAGEHKRYSTWMRAVRTVRNLHVIEGFYKENYRENPDSPLKSRQEKQTDVNIGIEMILDALGPTAGPPNRVLVLSDDSDLMPPIFALRERTSRSISVTVLLPSSADLGGYAEKYRQTESVLRRCHRIVRNRRTPGLPLDIQVLDESTLANSLLPYELTDREGTFRCPDQWSLGSAYLAEHCSAEHRPDRHR